MTAAMLLRAGYLRRLQGILLVLVCLGATGCRERVDSPAPEEESSLPTTTTTPRLDVVTLIAFAEIDPSHPQESGESAWQRYRAAMLELEATFEVATVLDADVVSMAGDCGPSRWDRMLIQRYQGVASLSEVVRSPRRSEALEWWDLAVADFHRVLGYSAPNELPSAATADSVDRVLLIESRDPDISRQIHSSERELLAPQPGVEWLQLSPDPNLNEVDAQWDLFSVTRFDDRDALTEALATEPLQMIRARWSTNSSRSCELLASPVASSEEFPQGL